MSEQEKNLQQMTELAKPSRELAEKLLRTELGYDQQLMGVRLSPMGGNIEHPIYTFTEAAKFIHIDPLDKLMGTRGGVDYLDMNLLQRWLSEVFGDTELARAIGEEVNKAENYAQMAVPVRKLLGQRLAQCQEVLEENKPQDESEKA